jgi:hypothetical protein
MAESRNIYGKVESPTSFKHVFLEIRHDVSKAKSRPSLTELYKRAGYLITLTKAPSWKKKFGKDAPKFSRLGKEEFRKTAKVINRRANQIGVPAEYDEQWGRSSRG